MRAAPTATERSPKKTNEQGARSDRRKLSRLDRFQRFLKRIVKLAVLRNAATQHRFEISEVCDVDDLINVEAYLPIEFRSSAFADSTSRGAA